MTDGQAPRLTGSERVHFTGIFMSSTELPAATHILVGLEASSKKQLVEHLATRAADLTDLAQRALFDAIMRRERLGSTAIGQGIALPHIAHAGLEQTLTILAVLKSPVDFDAADNQPVDVVCLVAGPEHADFDHLKCVSSMARLLRADGVCQNLRTAVSAEDALRILQAPKKAEAA
jgi:PTS system nitrogen regulatory IIA component